MSEENKRNSSQSNNNNNEVETNSNQKKRAKLSSSQQIIDVSEELNLDNDFLDNYVDKDTLPPLYKRETNKRIFVNRNLRMENIKFIGFDMDYTLAVYKSPQYEVMSYNLVIGRLIEMGYPKEIRDLSFDPTFPIRGLFLDPLLGNLLKVDQFGFIKSCVHGRRILTKPEIKSAYPSCLIRNDDIQKRFFLLNTLFSIVDASVFSDLVRFFENIAKNSGGTVDDDVEDISNISAEEEENKLGIHYDDLDISYTNLFQDIRSAIDYVHMEGKLKEETSQNFDTYVEKTGKRMSILFDSLRKAGKKVFLLTNSRFKYSDKLMSFLLNEQNPEYQNWKDYFDYIIVGAKKPSWFGKGTTLREVNLQTGQLEIGNISSLEKNHIYNGGNLSKFTELTGANGPEVLYVGDHIFSDIIISKKSHQWRNLLVVRELEQEIHTWSKAFNNYNHILNLKYLVAEAYRGLDYKATVPPKINAVRKRIKEKQKEFDESFNTYFGSLFGEGANQSFMAMQIRRYADLYTADYLNLLNYPLFYYFCVTNTYLPHQMVVSRNIEPPLLRSVVEVDESELEDL